MLSIDRQNILVFLYDSLGAINLEDIAALPCLSQLYKESAVFTRAYTPNPQSSPARASLFTGLDPCVHGLWTNGVTLPAAEQTFAQTLFQAGYTNYFAGRFQLAGVSQWTTENLRPNEFAQADWAHGPLHRSRQNAYLNWLQASAPQVFDQLFDQQALPEDTHITAQQRAVLDALSSEYSFNRWVGNRISEWLAATPANEPFLAIASFCVGDRLGAEPLIESDGEMLNLQALQQSDAAIKSVLDELKRSGRYDDTAIIVAAARGNVQSNNGNDFLSEPCVQVPLLIRQPAVQQCTVDTLVSTIDLAPTVHELAGISTVKRVQGRSLLSVIDNPESANAWVMSRLRAGSQNTNQNWQSAFYQGSMKLILQHGDEESIKLVDLSKDPLEQQNLANVANYQEELERMIDLMIDARCALEDRTEPRIAEF